MYPKDNLAYFILAGIAALGLTPLIVSAEAQAQIAFTSERDGNREIYVMDADGGNQQRLTNSRLVDWDPSWSPDGRHIAFTANGRPGDWGARGGDLEIYVMDANGSNPRKLTNNLRQDTDPAWAPDGKRIAYTSTIDRNKEIYVMDADKGWERGKPRRLTNSGDVHIHNWDPSWSPDSERIAFTSNRDGNLEIYVMDTDGGNQRRLTNSGDIHIHNSKPSWSPDGRRIAFMSDREGNSKIYVMNADGGQQLNRTRDMHGDEPSWSPDGQRIVFVSERDGNKEIYTINADGRRDPRRLTKNRHNDTDPAWYNPAVAFAVAPADKKITMWGWFKQVDR
ncbi:PD40 domain-containing protein [Candidatus Poribacteria bacterium]|nr:PD40 domain-containing protein [Candidatus Poribacteria bacterium]